MDDQRPDFRIVSPLGFIHVTADDDVWLHWDDIGLHVETPDNASAIILTVDEARELAAALSRCADVVVDRYRNG